MDLSLIWIYNTYLKLKKNEIILEKLETIKTDTNIVEIKNTSVEKKIEKYKNEISLYQQGYDQILFKLFHNMQQRQEQKEM